MTDEEFDALGVGDIIKTAEDGHACLVIGRDEYGIIAIRVIRSGNASKWELVGKTNKVFKK